ncbi:hypothetical protein CDAR_417561 [Caerostris darwini]|uniref:Uncharacterized protein n=1 Tax=Caerostris darwini TaxID=1538125 RepID=A0AAV4WH07_9ARAC|nr:hypothetical protein CDAR_417561 [Caerostris darwini]
MESRIQGGRRKLKGNGWCGGWFGVAWWGWNKFGCPSGHQKGAVANWGIGEKEEGKIYGCVKIGLKYANHDGELTGTAQEAKRDWDSSHITWKSDLDIMPLKGKIQRRFDLVIGSTSRYFRQVPPPSTHPFTPQELLRRGEKGSFYFFGRTWADSVECGCGEDFCSWFAGRCRVRKFKFFTIRLLDCKEKIKFI